MSEYSDFFNHVYFGNREICHSGILSRIGHLDPTYDYPLEKRQEALGALEQFADHSITAYRAIEYWAQFFGFPSPGWQMSEQANAILSRVQKPKTYLAWDAVRVDVE